MKLQCRSIRENGVRGRRQGLSFFRGNFRKWLLENRAQGTGHTHTHTTNNTHAHPPHIHTHTHTHTHAHTQTHASDPAKFNILMRIGPIDKVKYIPNSPNHSLAASHYGSESIQNIHQRIIQALPFTSWWKWHLEVNKYFNFLPFFHWEALMSWALLSPTLPFKGMECPGAHPE